MKSQMAQIAATNFDESLAKDQTAYSYSVVSLFSGCGGLDQGFVGGFEFLGKIYDPMPYRIVWANDIRKSACDTYKDNLGHEIHHEDIWEALRHLPSQADLVIGGFPCQDVSINGKMKVGNGSRTTLYRAMIETIRRTKPLVFCR